MKKDISKLSEGLNKILNEMKKVVIGQDEVLESILLGLMCNGHVLLEGVPGVAKTLMVRALAKTINVEFKRIQFTPDLMPSDVTGIMAYNPKTGEFEFKPGPIFTNLVLADEINRAPPKTQAAMLESMQERQVSIEKVTYALPKPFMVLATMNPVEQEGTYALPEAQVDRFLFKIIVTYPEVDDEIEIVRRFTSGIDAYQTLEQLKSVMTGDEIMKIQQLIREQVKTEPEIIEYIVKLVNNTRRSEEVEIGGSPRASLWITVAAKAYALLKGRDYVNPADVQRVAPLVLRHRVIVKPEWEFEGITSDVIVQRALKYVEPPSIE